MAFPDPTYCYSHLIQCIFSGLVYLLQLIMIADHYCHVVLLGMDLGRLPTLEKLCTMTCYLRFFLDFNENRHEEINNKCTTNLVFRTQFLAPNLKLLRCFCLLHNKHSIALRKEKVFFNSLISKSKLKLVDRYHHMQTFLANLSTFRERFFSGNPQ